ncbi:hypothetical protein C0585_00185 [Candidatus Woesearchaeota archaeon]|nr:MAG: hypothetical protein C0585_00185 [Candidatus Woesearchaeota archaeon]
MEEKKCIIVRYSEIALKGKNRARFENRLIENIKFYLDKEKVKYDKVIKLNSRILILTEIIINLKPVFGILNYSNATYLEYDYEILKEKAEKFADSLKNKETFRVSVQRIDKNIGKKSVDMERDFGEIIYEKTKNPVSLKEFDRNFEIELFGGNSYIFEGKIDCFGGLPIGTDLNTSSIISNKKDILANLLMMRRGVVPNPILIKENMDISLLKNFLNTPSKIDIIKENIDEKNFIIEKKLRSIIKGENLEGINENIKEDILILRPLINMTEKDIDEELVKYYGSVN